MKASTSQPGVRSSLRDVAAEKERSLTMGWCTLGSPLAAEVVAYRGPDLLCLDLEHGLMGWDRCLESIMILSRSPIPVLVRVPENRDTEIAKALDTGAHGVVVPHIDTAEDAAAAVSATRYPTEGHRSWGPTRASLLSSSDPAEVNERVACIVMLETPLAITNCTGIAATAGVDALLVGSNDLSLALCTPDRSAAEIRQDALFAEMLAAVADAGHSAGIPVAAPAGSIREAETLRTLDFDVIVLPSDVALLRRAVELEIETLSRLGSGSGQIIDEPSTPSAAY